MKTIKILSCELVAENPHMNGMPEGSRHYHVKLGNGNRRFTFHWSQGPAIEQEPKLADMLETLICDMQGYDNARGFEDWAAEYGYDTDSRKAEKIYRVVKAQSEKLKRFLGQESSR